GSFSGFPSSTQDSKVLMYIYYGYNGDSLLFKEIEFNLNKIIQKLEFEASTSRLRVGEKSSLKVRGVFLNSTQIPFELKLKISAGRSEQIQFLNVPLEIEFRSKMQNWKLPASGSFNNNIVEVVCENIIAFEDNTQWELELPFQLFLTSELFVDFSGYVAENSCFFEDESSLRLPIEPFCVYPLRDIELIDGAELIGYYPNPVEDYLILEFESLKKDFAFIQIFDNLGNAITEKMKIDIGVGKYKEKINFRNFENGIYFVKLYFENRTKQIMVLKVK
ncbi:MAG: T9SS type A sorting domain-containing protein, partial [Candidatus Kapaibacteriota bacterium]